MNGSGERVTRRSVLGALAGASVCGVLRPGTAAAAGGDVVWEFETGSYVRSSPTVADGTVFVGSDDESVYALDAGDGSQLWESFDESAVLILILLTSSTYLNVQS